LLNANQDIGADGRLIMRCDKLPALFGIDPPLGLLFGAGSAGAAIFRRRKQAQPI
jgi:hypothetical protein